MNENSQPGFGKISMHGDGMGVPTPELVEQRAREIAMIDERNPDEFTDTDWDEARRELLGLASSDESSSGAEGEEWDVVASDTGHRLPRAGLEDDELLGEQLVSGGLDEAAHDQMVQARRDELSQEGGVIEGA